MWKQTKKNNIVAFANYILNDASLLFFPKMCSLDRVVTIYGKRSKWEIGRLC